MCLYMVNCSKCGKKLGGFFNKKYQHITKKGIVYYCSNCDLDSEINQMVDSEIKASIKIHKDCSSFIMPEEFNTEKKRVTQTSIRKLNWDDSTIKSEQILDKLNLKIVPIPNKDFLKEVSSICFICLNKLLINPYISNSKEYIIVNNFKVCQSCVSKIDNEVSKLENRLSKIRTNEHNLIDKNAIKIISKYLSNKDVILKTIILSICKTNLFDFVEENDLDFLKEHYIKLHKRSQEHIPSNALDYDKIMQLENDSRNALQLIEDIIKIEKLLRKKNIKINYIQILEEMFKIVEKELTEEIEKITIPAHKLISKINKINKKIIVKEYFNLGFEHVNYMIISNLFDKFGLSYSENEIHDLIAKYVEERELDKFEIELGENKNKIGDFAKLNGYQFEEYLKELFSILGYQAIKTKGSGDQGADLIIKKENEKTVVQSKKYRGSVTNKAIQEVVASKKYYGADKAMVVTTGKFTKSAIDLAKSNDVELIDKNKLITIIKGIGKSSKNKSNLLNVRKSEFVLEVGVKFVEGKKYFIDEQGDLSIIDWDKQPKKLVKLGIKKEAGYTYFLDEQGDVRRKR